MEFGKHCNFSPSREGIRKYCAFVYGSCHPANRAASCGTLHCATAGTGRTTEKKQQGYCSVTPSGRMISERHTVFAS